MNIDLCADMCHLKSVSFSIQCSRVESDTVIRHQERTSTSTRTQRSSAKVSQGNRFVLTCYHHQHIFFIIASQQINYCNLVVKSQFFRIAHTHKKKYLHNFSFFVCLTSFCMSKITREMDSKRLLLPSIVNKFSILFHLGVTVVQAFTQLHKLCQKSQIHFIYIAPSHKFV